MAASSQGRQDADAPSGENLPRAVYNALTEAGLDVVRNVGPGPFHVDLAIRNPDNPDRYLLGIECDGSEYHDEPSARDRERLRLQVLEQLGWRIHRVWSVDWFRTPRRELDRLIQALEKARRGQLRPQLATAPPTPTATTVVSEGPDQATPYVMYGIDEPRDSGAFYTGDIRSLAKVAGEIIALEGPIHRDELARRMAAAWGISRVGSRVADRVGRATDQLLKAERIVIRDEFCRPAEMETPTPRRRDDEHLRDVDLICDEEIAAAARKLLGAQFGMSREDLASQTAYLLGFASTGKRIAEKIDRVVGEQIRAGRIVEQDGMCRNAET
jgi:very-short-patch-repair endonuclease